MTTALATTVFTTAVSVFKAAKADDPGDALEALLGLPAKFFPESNDAKVSKEFKKQFQEMVLTQEERFWNGRKASEKPTAEDVFHGYEQLKEATAKAHSNRKRKILWNAFWNSFKPEFYAEGIREILWAKVEQLDYPDFIYLAEIIRGQAKNQYARLNESSIEHAERLEKQGLLHLKDADTPGSKIVNHKGYAEMMRDFALKEFEFYETKPAT